MAKKTKSKPMNEIVVRLRKFDCLEVKIFDEDDILNKPVEVWPDCDVLISFHSGGFPLEKAADYAELRRPLVVNDITMQYIIQSRVQVYKTLQDFDIDVPRYAVVDRSDPDNPPIFEEHEDHIEINGEIFHKPFVEKPVSAEDHNIIIYFQSSAGGGSQRLFRKIGNKSSAYSTNSSLRTDGSYIYEDFQPTDGTDVKIYTVGPEYAHAEARKSPALDGRVERDRENKEVRYPVILTAKEKHIARKVCLAFKQTICGFDLLRAHGKSLVCDVNGFSFVKNSQKYYDDSAKVLGNMIMQQLGKPVLSENSSRTRDDDLSEVISGTGMHNGPHNHHEYEGEVDENNFVPTTKGVMELRCVIAVIRHADRTPKQKMKMEVTHDLWVELFNKWGSKKGGKLKLKRPKQLQEVLETARRILYEIQQKREEDDGVDYDTLLHKYNQMKTVLEMYGHFSGINRKVQFKSIPNKGDMNEGETQKLQNV